MNVTAAMPVSAVNTEIMGTAAATDSASTGTGDFKANRGESAWIKLE